MRKIPNAGRNALWLIFGRCAQLGIQLATGLLTARYLGPEGYGLLHYGTAYTALLASVCNLGLQTVLVTEFTRQPEKDGEILGSALMLRGLSGILSGVMLLYFAPIAHRDDPEAAAIVCLSAVGLALQMGELFQSWFQWRLQSRVTAVTLLGAGLLASAYRLAMVFLRMPPAAFVLAGAVEQAAAGGTLYLAYRRMGGKKLCISRSRGIQLLKRSCHFILPGLMAAVYAQTDKLMLRYLVGDAQTGLYATAVSLSGIWGFVLSAVIDSAYPGIAEVHGKDPAAFDRKNRRLYTFVFYLSGAVSLGITWLAEPVVMLLYGKAYLGAVLPLQILTWQTAFSYLGVARNIWVVCENAQKHLVWVYTAGALVNVGLNWLLIPSMGAAGAAIASLVCQMATALAAPLLIPALRKNSILMLQAIVLGKENRK